MIPGSFGSTVCKRCVCVCVCVCVCSCKQMTDNTLLWISSLFSNDISWPALTLNISRRAFLALDFLPAGVYDSNARCTYTCIYI